MGGGVVGLGLGSPENDGRTGIGFDSRRGAPVRHILLGFDNEDIYLDKEEDGMNLKIKTNDKKGG